MRQLSCGRRPLVRRRVAAGCGGRARVLVPHRQGDSVGTVSCRTGRAGQYLRLRQQGCRYTLTPDGIKVAVFYTKLHNRLLRPLLAADQPQAPPELRAALRTIDQHIGTYITRARLSPAP